VGVLGVALGRLVRVVAVRVVAVQAAAAVAEHGDHHHDEADLQPVRGEVAGHDGSLL